MAVDRLLFSLETVGGGKLLIDFVLELVDELLDGVEGMCLPSIYTRRIMQEERRKV